jgi:uncharacterized protein (TIGR02646 family)
MRHIDLDDLQARIPPGWADSAREALETLRDCAPAERSTALERYRDVWRRLGPALAELSKGKCWYCETREIRSDNPVDHFRPKSRVADCPDHPGYWWLAFDWHNFRYSCTFCNSRRRDPATGEVGGKHDNFPLLNPDERAYTEADDIDREQPELLDPARQTDTTLIWYRDDGLADALVTPAQQPTQHQRAKRSINLYHLNHTETIERRLELVRHVRKQVALGTEYLEDWKAGNKSAETGYREVVAELLRLMSKEAPFSVAAKHMIRSLADARHRWIDTL